MAQPEKPLTNNQRAEQGIEPVHGIRVTATVTRPSHEPKDAKEGKQ